MLVFYLSVFLVGHVQEYKAYLSDPSLIARGVCCVCNKNTKFENYIAIALQGRMYNIVIYK